MDPFIFTVSAVLVVKKTDKFDPWKSNFSDIKIHTGSTLFAFFTRKSILEVKMIGSTRNLVKF